MLYREGYDIAVSRAVARLNVLAELCMPFVKTGGYFLAHKGTDSEEEIAEAETAIAELGGEIERTEKYFHGAIIVVRKVRQTPEKYPRRWKKIESAPL